jgi:hypothetical protein
MEEGKTGWQIVEEMAGAASLGNKKWLGGEELGVEVLRRKKTLPHQQQQHQQQQQLHLLLLLGPLAAGCSSSPKHTRGSCGGGGGDGWLDGWAAAAAPPAAAVGDGPWALPGGGPPRNRNKQPTVLGADEWAPAAEKAMGQRRAGEMGDGWRGGMGMGEEEGREGMGRKKGRLASKKTASSRRGEPSSRGSTEKRWMPTAEMPIPCPGLQFFMAFPSPAKTGRKWLMPNRNEKCHSEKGTNDKSPSHTGSIINIYIFFG